MDENNFMRRLLKLPSFELCGSKIYKTWLNNRKIGKSSAVYWISGILLGILTLIVGHASNGFSWLVGFITLALFATLIAYDFDALLCYYNKKSEYYRATGVTKEDISNDKGLAGEFNAYVLSKKIKVPHKTLYNVCVPMPNGNFQEVDAIIITPHLIYVLECKNRTGYFEIDFNKKNWIQYIGNQKHVFPNIYLQNQEHIIAIDNYLLSKKVFNESPIYRNLVLTGGDFFCNTDIETPEEFFLGDMFQMVKVIERNEQQVQKNRGEDFMNNVYMALLPYALNGKAAKENMVHEREMRGLRGEIVRGDYRYYRFKNDDSIVEDSIIALLSEKNVLLRKNNVYTQIGFLCESYYYWKAAPNITYIEKS